jgi:hypothetical protein
MLINCTHKGTSWEHGDSQLLFKNNLKRQAGDWLYRHKKISYVWNRQGYRCAEFDSIIWNKSDIVMGCSYVSGTGLALEDTLPWQLEQHTGRATINLGYPSSGTDIILANTISMIDAGAIPNQAIILVPELTRLAYYTVKGVINYIPNARPLNPMYAEWLAHKPNAEHHGWLNLKAVAGLWASQGVPVHFFERIPVEGYAMGPRLPGQVDLARDIHVDEHGNEYAHCGSATVGLWAKAIASAI